jgi:L-lysine 6-transaminase
MLASKRIDEAEHNVFNVSSRINSTWGGSLVDMVRATKILEIIEEDNLCAKAAENGEYLQQQLIQIADTMPVIQSVRSKGLLTAFDFPDKATRDKFIQQGIANNVMFLGCGTRTIRFRPALIIEKNNIDEGLFILKKIIKNFQM